MSGSFVVAVSDDDGSCSVGGNDSSGAFTSLLEKVVLAQGSLFVCELVQIKSDSLGLVEFAFGLVDSASEVFWEKY